MTIDRPLAIVGSNPRGRELVPWDDPKVEIWLFNEAPQAPEKYPRWDVCLQMHKVEVYTSPENWNNKKHWDWLQQEHPGKTIYMIEADERVPNSVTYPLEEVLAQTPYRYLRSTPAMALALAIYLGYTDISLYGSELTSNTEYQYQAVNYAYWIGIAHGKGINLKLRCWQDEFEQPIYGYEGETQIGRDFFEQRAAIHDKAWRINELALTRIKEKIDDAMYKTDFGVVARLTSDIELAALATGETAAALAEAECYSKRSNPISRQEFERASAQAQQDGEGVREKMFKASGKAEYVWNVWKQTGRNEALNQLRQFLLEYGQLAYGTGAQLGIFHESLIYMGEYDKLTTALGGQRAVAQVLGGNDGNEKIADQG